MNGPQTRQTVEGYDRVVRLGDQKSVLDVPVGKGGQAPAPLVDGKGPFFAMEVQPSYVLDLLKLIVKRRKADSVAELRLPMAVSVSTTRVMHSQPTSLQFPGCWLQVLMEEVSVTWDMQVAWLWRLYRASGLLGLLHRN